VGAYLEHVSNAKANGIRNLAKLGTNTSSGETRYLMHS
jgi:hypothetical protein